jgi:hypothetical protein
VNIPVEFVLFGMTLLGVAVFHRHTLKVALLGLAAITVTRSSLATSTVSPACWACGFT